jgi:hypothetical protein
MDAFNSLTFEGGSVSLILLLVGVLLGIAALPFAFAVRTFRYE